MLQLTREKLKTTLMHVFFGGVVGGTRRIMGNVKIVNWRDLRKHVILILTVFVFVVSL